MRLFSDRSGSSYDWFIVLLVPNREANNLFLEWPRSFTERLKIEN